MSKEEQIQRWAAEEVVDMWAGGNYTEGDCRITEGVYCKLFQKFHKNFNAQEWREYINDQVNQLS